MKKISKITKGYANLITGKHLELRLKRESICKRCPISSDSKLNYSEWCQTELGGCGCYIPSKASVKEEECPKGKW